MAGVAPSDEPIVVGDLSWHLLLSEEGRLPHREILTPVVVGEWQETQA